MTRTEQELKNAHAMPKKTGKADYIRFLNGEHITRDGAIRARCYECVGGEDTTACKTLTCALILYCPWNRFQELNC